jgi:tRNA 2-thiouridine synthesizing protein A
VRSVGDWSDAHGVAYVAWTGETVDPFLNINTLDDLARAEAAAGRHQDSRMIRLDLSGLKCPLPVLRTRKALRNLRPGDRLHVVCTDPLASIDVPNLLRETGDVLEDQQHDGQTLVFVILKAA